MKELINRVISTSLIIIAISHSTFAQKELLASDSERREVRKKFSSIIEAVTMPSVVAEKNERAEPDLALSLSPDTDVTFAVNERKTDTLPRPEQIKYIKSRGIATWVNNPQEENMKHFFALHKTAPIGTIVQVKNLMNQRVVSVKILGKLRDDQRNKGVSIKISGAAAQLLFVLDEKFVMEEMIPESAMK